MIRSVFKTISVFSWLAAFVVTGLLAMLVTPPKHRHYIRTHIARFYCNRVQKALGLKVRYKPEDMEKARSGQYLILANHLSYLDVVSLFNIVDASFLTSKEVKRHWFLGPICILGGCYFVDRQRPSGVAREIDNLSKHLEKGLNLAIFPEGTTGDGTKVLPFKPTLVETAIRAKREVLPICINYRSLNGERINLQNRDTLYWYGDMTFFPHLLKILSQKSIEVEIEVLPTIPIGNANRKTLADKAFQVISSRYQTLC